MDPSYLHQEAFRAPKVLRYQIFEPLNRNSVSHKQLYSLTANGAWSSTVKTSMLVSYSQHSFPFSASSTKPVGWPRVSRTNWTHGESTVDRALYTVINRKDLSINALWVSSYIVCLPQGPIGPTGHKGEYGFPGRPVSVCQHQRTR